MAQGEKTKLLWKDTKYREQMVKAHKGNVPSNLDELIKISKSVVGRARVSKMNKGRTPWNKGKVKVKSKEEELEYKRKRSWSKNTRNRQKRANGGNHTYKEWLNLKKEYNNCCACCYMSDKEAPLTQDHIIPVSLGGSDNIGNIQPLCSNCNIKKMTKVIKFKKVK